MPLFQFEIERMTPVFDEYGAVEYYHPDRFVVKAAGKTAWSAADVVKRSLLRRGVQGTEITIISTKKIELIRKDQGNAKPKN